jgi:hypothetical protein
MSDHIEPTKLSALLSIRDQFKGNEGAAQRCRVEEVLRRGYALSTFEASRYLDVYYCPARIKELRNLGMNIVTHWVQVFTESGQAHRVGNYVLVRGVADGA